MYGALQAYSCRRSTPTFALVTGSHRPQQSWLNGRRDTNVTRGVGPTTAVPWQKRARVPRLGHWSGPSLSGPHHCPWRCLGSAAARAVGGHSPGRPAAFPILVAPFHASRTRHLDYHPCNHCWVSPTDVLAVDDGRRITRVTTDMGRALAAHPARPLRAMDGLGSGDY